MIAVSTNPISLSLTLEEFFSFFENPQKAKNLFVGSNIKNLPGTEENIEFLLKRVAVFSLKLDKEKGENYLQYTSTKNMVFQTVIRFEYLQDQGIAIHLETDTNIFMELFLERRIKKLIETVVLRLKETFKQVS